MLVMRSEMRREMARQAHGSLHACTWADLGTSLQDGNITVGLHESPIVARGVLREVQEAWLELCKIPGISVWAAQSEHGFRIVLDQSIIWPQRSVSVCWHIRSSRSHPVALG